MLVPAMQEAVSSFFSPVLYSPFPLPKDSNAGKPQLAVFVSLICLFVCIAILLNFSSLGFRTVGFENR